MAPDMGMMKRVGTVDCPLSWYSTRAWRASVHLITKPATYKTPVRTCHIKQTHKGNKIQIRTNHKNTKKYKKYKKYKKMIKKNKKNWNSYLTISNWLRKQRYHYFPNNNVYQTKKQQTSTTVADFKYGVYTDVNITVSVHSSCMLPPLVYVYFIFIIIIIIIIISFFFEGGGGGWVGIICWLTRVVETILLRSCDDILTSERVQHPLDLLLGCRCTSSSPCHGGGALFITPRTLIGTCATQTLQSQKKLQFEYNGADRFDKFTTLANLHHAH